MRGLALVALLALLTSLGACVHPRRSTSLSPVQDASSLNHPSNVWRLRFTKFIVPPRQRGGQPWDDDGSTADPFVRVYRGDQLLFESEPVRNELQPDLEGVVTENLYLPTTDELRIELWDSDQVLPAPIGTWRGRGLPRSALPGADANLMLEGNATVAFRVEPPEAFRGTGIELYEARGGGLKVLAVIERSPAGRAGVGVGDLILEIDGEPVSDLGEGRAASQLSMAGSRGSRLRVRHENGQEEDVELDRGYVWPTR
ncbi:MAG TPA: PDZ domain-containing protein [Polyangiaceae bacterium LLY-WYZ-15_(1-7)]|nr:PDZ domain-containing protein [Polyangiaceae bacterium LLY-WYZ-15_(1-7)]HJL06906.1 PDZ domain-containing protein [Polyangiaceae bacterium LLY-WYZ-15_(1-7)]HJL25087.1 PDZ domain-containing protein [Polyangiaceae bacterium LLY-WYZ-15_(1-7)]HJL33503.1 PDZ domain-containing protein [Polyangiaceae bacterium LLY-WYZ-15_(1-7)]HJL36733.1 PDZ domain-containing protein [Polyangiaceae bacterium LLY-WYZ-15_(1-7)]